MTHSLRTRAPRWLFAATLAALSPPAAAQSLPPDLIRALALPVVVSSTVANHSDLPAHLVDGNLETAWNGRTGQLGESNAFTVRVPPGSLVSELRITAGYTRVTPRGDLFLQNHRVRRVRVTVSAPGAPVVNREFALDVNRRDLQSFPLGTGGGTYEIRLLDLVPGTQRNWREACVSELQLVGRGSNPAWMIPEPLVVDVGFARPMVQVTGPFASPQAACTDLQRARDRARCRELEGCGCTSEATARVNAAGFAGANPVLGVRLLRSSTTPNEGPRCHLAVQTAGGWFTLGDLATCGRPDPQASNLAGYARASMTVREIAVRNGPNGDPVLRVAYDTDEGMYAMEGYDDERDRGTRWDNRTRSSLSLQCRVSAAGQPECLLPRATAPSRVE